jgi:hypothetical protein
VPRCAQKQLCALQSSSFPQTQNLAACYFRLVLSCDEEEEHVFARLKICM